VPDIDAETEKLVKKGMRIIMDFHLNGERLEDYLDTRESGHILLSFRSPMTDEMKKRKATALSQLNSIQAQNSCPTIGKERQYSRTEMAPSMHTSRAELDRLLDPQYDALTLSTLRKAALAVGRRLRIELL
jgi:hypothetical protein